MRILKCIAHWLLHWKEEMPGLGATLTCRAVTLVSPEIAALFGQEGISGIRKSQTVPQDTVPENIINLKLCSWMVQTMATTMRLIKNSKISCKQDSLKHWNSLTKNQKWSSQSPIRN